MSSVSAERVINQVSLPADRTKSRFPSYGNDPKVLADIYEEEINIAIWQRPISERLENAVRDFLIASPRFETAMSVSPDRAHAGVSEATGGTAPTELVDNVAELLEMFCYLFGLKRAGLRLATLNRAMCPRFHVDRVPCRLVTTYHGVATEWLPHQAVDRSKLGGGSNGQSDLDSGLFADQSDIQRLTCGDVALLKGELWTGNEDAGLVHRSPAVPAGEKRLLLTLDVVVP
jgi:hypothetical protein